MRRTDLKAAASFTGLRCARCGKGPDTYEARTSHWWAAWMSVHEGEHRALDRAANQPLISLDGTTK